MLQRLFCHMRQNVVAYLALFVALGGSSAWAMHEVINSSDVVNETLLSEDIKNGEIGSADVKDNSINTFDANALHGSDIIDGSLTGADVADNSLTGADVFDNSIGSADVTNNSLTGSDVNEASLNLAAEPWHEVGAPGEPGFSPNNPFCEWSNVDPQVNSAAFLRDRFGFVHLKGFVKVTALDQSLCSLENLPPNRRIFILSAGYTPVAREVHATVTNLALGTITVAANGDVSAGPPTSTANAKQNISLDGISFRCAPSGQNGCP